MIRIVLAGAAGRMGREIAAAVAADEALEIVLGLERAEHPAVGTTLEGVPVVADLQEAECVYDVIVDFTSPAACVSLARAAGARGTAFVSGTTGLDTDAQQHLRAVGKQVPVLYAPNMSRGVTALGGLVTTLARQLEEYDIEIAEMHHRRKRDAPSGTALRLAELIQSVRHELEAVHGRHGLCGPRRTGELGIHALRGGDVVGEHRVVFAGPGERLILTHVADSRDAFVGGVLAAVRFVVRQPPGFYGMTDVLGVG